ncbi:MAG: amino acid permease, partial [Halobacteriovoraceae bacterium]|nr:amino acid permease [Halobacteriovoraceae bacterium]
MASLERRLGLSAIIVISLSSMIGSGIFVLPGIGFSITGPSLFLAFILSAICILPAAISKAELATAMPTSGGTYIYIERTFGPLIGTVGGLGLFLSILLKAAFSLVGIGAYFSVFSNFPLMPTMLTFLFCIILLNIFGVGKVSKILTVVLIITIIGLGLLAIFSIPSWNITNLSPLMTNGLDGLMSATALVFVSFAGVTKIAAIAEEVKSPEKNLPKAILFSLFLVTLIYCCISLILAGVFSNAQIAGEIKPIYKLAFEIGGSVAGTVFAVIATLTLVNTANAGILAGSRFPFAMARDNLLPKFLGNLHSTFITPIVSILLSGIIIVAILTTMDVAKIAKLASAFMILSYISDNLAV